MEVVYIKRFRQFLRSKGEFDSPDDIVIMITFLPISSILDVVISRGSNLLGSIETAPSSYSQSNEDHRWCLNSFLVIRVVRCTPSNMAPNTDLKVLKMAPMVAKIIEATGSNPHLGPPS